ncbi:hypothetical protein AeMF1_003014 [Aphanomyces euteiches]|nr:hypothetical protein AeMF1_005154 [Aphanomyces euteiches]KAH9126571.1 hypothetical protein AeMF1_003014 [Aphanomyces euteiches]KAH9182441.1 hypothetical protein AeNC1_015584 [Aphanomyces euteiches]
MCDTIFNCPTLDTLAFVNCYLNGIDFANCSFQMRSLEIQSGMDRQTSESFLNQLAGSKVTHFKWIPPASNDTMAEIEHLFRILPFTSIQELDLSHNKFSNTQWGCLAALLATCPLKALTLQHCQLTHEDIIWLAPAIRKNKTITKIDLCSNKIGYEGVCFFAEYAYDPERTVSMKLLSWERNSISDENKVKVKELIA